MTTTENLKTVSQDRLREIYEEEGGDLARMAVRLSVAMPVLAAPNPTPVARRRAPPAEIGQPNLRKYTVSTRNCQTPLWPSQDYEKIATARRKYEAGTHEMCQGRDGEWFILYLIPRNKRVAPRRFFSLES